MVLDFVNVYDEYIFIKSLRELIPYSIKSHWELINATLQ